MATVDRLQFNALAIDYVDQNGEFFRVAKSNATRFVLKLPNGKEQRWEILTPEDSPRYEMVKRKARNEAIVFMAKRYGQWLMENQA